MKELSSVFATKFLSAAVVLDFSLIEKDAADAGYPGEWAGAVADIAYSGHVGDFWINGNEKHD